MVIEMLIVLCLGVGATFVLLGALGLAKWPDYYMRLHAPTLIGTLGIGGVLLGSLLYSNLRGGQIHFQGIILMLFLFCTAPLTAHMLAKSALSSTSTANKDNKHGR